MAILGLVRLIWSKILVEVEERDLNVIESNFIGCGSED